MGGKVAGLVYSSARPPEASENVVTFALTVRRLLDRFFVFLDGKLVLGKQQTLEGEKYTEAE